MAKKPAEVSKTMKTLSAYVSGALRKALPKEVVETAKLHLLDTLAAMVSGSHLIPGRRAIGYVKTLGGTKEACVVGTRIVTTAVNAALANGMLGHADETDDSHAAGLFHPGTCIVPAALALAERNGEGGTALLRAMVVGYDIGARLAMSLPALPFFLRGHHTPSFGGLFGASAAAGAMMRLDPERMRYHFSYTAQQAAGLACLLRDPEHVEKAFDMGGMPAQNAVQAALMVAHGFTGVADVFSGDRNFYAAFAPDGDPERLARDLGKTYEIMNSSIKKWPVGAPILAPMDALETLRKAHSFRAADVEKVVITIPEKEAAIVNNRAAPDISLQHLVALMMVDGAVTFESAHDFQRMRDPAVTRLRSRVELVGSAEMTDPQRRWHAHAEVTLRDGRTLKHYTYAARGSSYNPMSREDENVKCRDLLAPVLGKRRAQSLIDTVWRVEKVKDVRELRKLFCA
jgi:2-methylcitrate dehydratase PrpD